MVGYDEFRARQREQLDAGRLVGIGIGLYIEPQSMIGPVQHRARAHPCAT